MSFDTGYCIRTLSGHSNYVYSLQILSNSRIASGSWDNSIKIWNFDTGYCIRTINLTKSNDNKNFVYSLLLLGENKLASGSDDKSIQIWNVDSGKCIQTLNGHSKYVRSLQSLTNNNFAIL